MYHKVLNSMAGDVDCVENKHRLDLVLIRASLSACAFHIMSVLISIICPGENNDISV